jgi:hypothetical protein
MLLAGTVAFGAVQANGYLASAGCNGTDALACMRRYLLTNQLTLNLSQQPLLPNPEGAHLSLSCTALGAQGTLGEWLSRGLSILLSPASYTPAQILETKDALAAFSES